ncbi:PREDICTED: myb-like protein I [Bactrocera latifrons]|uniref:ITPR-interacting domain-containing protein n=1 Tax=Bactrocera latifrons TaxID=174628 RepID=A0A0K8W7P2_BACLA|nr:PREDICTED: myb-like protein I [Bactrocera latifrons]
MDTTLTTWFSCNEETQCYDTNNNNNSSNQTHNASNNMYNSHSNNNDNSNSTNYANTTDVQVTFNQRRPNELRQTRLQRQHEQLHYSSSSSPIPTQLVQSPDTLSATQTPVAQHANAEKSRSPSLAQRWTRRKRLQRQKPTELDDADFAYAADLEEEDEEEEALLKQQQQASTMFNVTPLMKTMCMTELPAPTFAEKRLSHFQQQHHSTPFDGQPSSLPNCFATAGSISTFHQQQHHQQHHHQHQHQQQQNHHHHHQMHQHHIRERRLKHEESFDSSTTTTTNTTDTPASPASPLLRRHHFAMLKRDNSTHSESSSRYSSVDSLLEARKPDPEAILINLGFGPVGSEDILSRIPKRFLKPSQVRGIDTEAFVRRLQLASNLADHSVLGYRGLTGNPDIPPSRIVAKIMQRFEVNERKKSMGSIEHTI